MGQGTSHRRITVVPAAATFFDAFDALVLGVALTVIATSRLTGLDEVIEVPGIAHTRTGTKLENPATRLLQGEAPVDVLSLAAVHRPRGEVS